MAHPYKDHKQSHNGHDRARAKHLLKGYKRGGAVKHEDGDKEALSAAKKIVKHEEKELKVEGKKHGGRLDKYARGGRAKSKKPHTQVNIAVVSGHGKDDHASAAPAGGPPSPGGASAAPPPPPAMPPMGGGMMPPGMMMGHPPIPPPGAMPPPGGKPPGMMKRGGRTKVIKKAFGGPLGGAPGVPQPPAVGMPAGMANFPHMPQGSQQLPPSQNYTDAMQALQQRGPDVQQQGGRFAGHPMMRPPGDPATATLNPMAQQALARMQAGQSPMMPFPQAPQMPTPPVPAGTQTGAFKRGGRTKGKMTAGMESGVGRLEASKNARKRG